VLDAATVDDLGTERPLESFLDKLEYLGSIFELELSVKTSRRSCRKLRK
jgi:hypothetical protein